MIKLIYLEKEDLNKILEWNMHQSADYLLQWAGPAFMYPLTYKQLENYYLIKSKSEDSKIQTFAIQLLYTGETIGTAELRQVDSENRIGRICRFLIGDENCRGKGIGTIVLKELLRIGFEELKFEKITLGVFDFNHGAIKCYEKAGFVKEKLIENARKASNEYWNLYEMFILKNEWYIKNQ